MGILVRCIKEEECRLTEGHPRVAEKLGSNPSIQQVNVKRFMSGVKALISVEEFTGGNGEFKGAIANPNGSSNLFKIIVDPNGYLYIMFT